MLHYILQPNTNMDRRECSEETDALYTERSAIRLNMFVTFGRRHKRFIINLKRIQNSFQKNNYHRQMTGMSTMP